MAAALVAGGMLAGSVSTAEAATITGTTSLPITYDKALTFDGTERVSFILNGDEFSDQGVLFGGNWRFNGGPDGLLSVVDNQVQPGNIHFLQPVTAAVIRSQTTPGGTTFYAYRNGNLVEEFNRFTNSEWLYFGFQDIIFDELRFLRTDGDSDPSFALNIDDIYFQVAPIPLPAGVWLLLSAVGGLGFVGRRKITAR